MTEQLRNELAKILDIDFEQVTSERELSTCQWDSISTVQFVSTMDLLYDQVIDPKDVEACRTIGDLVALIQVS